MWQRGVFPSSLLPFSPCGRRWREAPDEGFSQRVAVGWAKRSVPTAPDDDCRKMVGTALARLCPPYFLTIRRQCSHAARIKFSLASGVRNAECADSVTF